MIELDANKWLLVKLACEKMAGFATASSRGGRQPSDPGGPLSAAMLHSYRWLADVADHNARLVSAAHDADAASRALASREPLYPQPAPWGLDTQD
jgi:microcystin degradation protein MlrC